MIYKLECKTKRSFNVRQNRAYGISANNRLKDNIRVVMETMLSPIDLLYFYFLSYLTKK